MGVYIKHNRSMSRYLYKALSCLMVIVFLAGQIGVVFPSNAYSQSLPTVQTGVFNLPAVGAMISTTPSFVPAEMKGIKIFPDNPLRFDFIIDTGNTQFEDDVFAEEASRLIKYFLTSLTVPEDELWVNLSPYEKDRIIPEKFGTTEMGRDLLAQDYLLKQITASLMYPQDDLGSEFWDRIYEKASELFGTTDVPVNTFNKVWIVPDKAVVYESGDVAFVTESHLKVMLEGDYLALKENMNNDEIGTDKLGSEDVKDISKLSSQIIREVILPEIEKEVNEGESFTALRQVYKSLILATWFKRNLRNNILGKVYVGENKVAGIEAEEKEIKEKIYKQYLEAFNVGVFNYIEEAYDPVSQEIIPRKYFSGGASFNGKEVGDVVEVQKVSIPKITSAADKAMSGPSKIVKIALESLADKARPAKNENPNLLRNIFIDEGAYVERIIGDGGVKKGEIEFQVKDGETTLTLEFFEKKEQRSKLYLNGVKGSDYLGAFGDAILILNNDGHGKIGELLKERLLERISFLTELEALGVMAGILDYGFLPVNFRNKRGKKDRKLHGYIILERLEGKSVEEVMQEIDVLKGEREIEEKKRLAEEVAVFMQKLVSSGKWVENIDFKKIFREDGTGKIKFNTEAVVAHRYAAEQVARIYLTNIGLYLKDGKVMRDEHYDKYSDEEKAYVDKWIAIDGGDFDAGVYQNPGAIVKTLAKIASEKSAKDDAMLSEIDEENLRALLEKSNLKVIKDGHSLISYEIGRGPLILAEEGNEKEKLRNIVVELIHPEGFIENIWTSLQQNKTRVKSDVKTAQMIKRLETGAKVAQRYLSDIVDAELLKGVELSEGREEIVVLRPRIVTLQEIRKDIIAGKNTNVVNKLREELANEIALGKRYKDLIDYAESKVREYRKEMMERRVVDLDFLSIERNYGFKEDGSVDILSIEYLRYGKKGLKELSAIIKRIRKEERDEDSMLEEWKYDGSEFYEADPIGADEFSLIGGVDAIKIKPVFWELLAYPEESELSFLELGEKYFREILQRKDDEGDRAMLEKDMYKLIGGEELVSAGKIEGEIIEEIGELNSVQARAVQELIENLARNGIIVDDFKPEQIMIEKSTGMAKLIDSEGARKVDSMREAAEYYLGRILHPSNAKIWREFDPEDFFDNFGSLAEALRKIAREDKLDEYEPPEFTESLEEEEKEEVQDFIEHSGGDVYLGSEDFSEENNFFIARDKGEIVGVISFEEKYLGASRINYVIKRVAVRSGFSKDSLLRAVANSALDRMKKEGIKYSLFIQASNDKIKEYMTGRGFVEQRWGAQSQDAENESKPLVADPQRVLDSLMSEEASSDQAMASEKEQNKNVGGIDLNPAMLDIESQGGGIDYNVPFDPGELESIHFDGFTPVILQIVPTNLPMFIGSSGAEPAQQLSFAGF